jgi:hypothetical protein
VVAAGLRFNYKEMFADIDSDRKRIRRLETALHDKGIQGILQYLY